MDRRPGKLLPIILAVLIVGLLGLTIFLALKINNQNQEISEIKSGKLDPKSIDKSKLSDDVFLTAKLDDGSITSAKIKNGSITSDKLDPETEIELLDKSVQKVEELINDNTIQIALPNGNIKTAQIIDNAVTTLKLADNSITEIKIRDGSITSGKIAAGQIEAIHLETGSIITAKIADGAIIESKVSDGAITSSKIANQSIIAAKIATGTITSTQISNTANITGGQLASDGSVVKSIVGNSIVEVTNNLDGTFGIRLTLDCSDKEVLRWNESSSQWQCSSDQKGSTITVAKSGGDYTTIQAGVQAALDAGMDATHPFEVDVYTGIYDLGTATLALPPGCNLIAHGAVTITSNPGAPFVYTIYATVIVGNKAGIKGFTVINTKPSTDIMMSTAIGTNDDITDSYILENKAIVDKWAIYIGVGTNLADKNYALRLRIERNDCDSQNSIYLEARCEDCVVKDNYIHYKGSAISYCLSFIDAGMTSDSKNNIITGNHGTIEFTSAEISQSVQAYVIKIGGQGNVVSNNNFRWISDCDMGPTLKISENRIPILWLESGGDQTTTVWDPNIFHGNNFRLELKTLNPNISLRGIDITNPAVLPSDLSMSNNTFMLISQSEMDKVSIETILSDRDFTIELIGQDAIAGLGDLLEGADMPNFVTRSSFVPPPQ